MSVTTVITDGGFDLLRAAPGHRLVYTKAVCGSGHVEKTQLATLTAVSGYVMDLSIVEMKPTKTAATLRLQMDNSKAPVEFQLYQIGVHAKLLDGDTEIIGDTLLQVMQYDQPDIVRAIPHISEFVVNTLMGQAEKVEGVIDLAAYVSLRQFNSTLSELEPTEVLITIQHDLGGYPLVVAGRLQHALGVGGVGEGPCGGSDTEQFAARARYLDSNQLSVLVPKGIADLGTEPELHLLGDREYAVTWPDNQVDSLYIRLIWGG